MCQNGGVDNQGEGTALASIVGGDLYGIAGGVNIASVRVMDDFGNALWSDVIAGMASYYLLCKLKYLIRILVSSPFISSPLYLSLLSPRKCFHSD